MSAILVRGGVIVAKSNQRPQFQTGPVPPDLQQLVFDLNGIAACGMKMDFSSHDLQLRTSMWEKDRAGNC